MIVESPRYGRESSRILRSQSSLAQFGYALPPAGPAGIDADLKCYGYFIDSKSQNKDGGG